MVILQGSIVTVGYENIMHHKARNEYIVHLNALKHHLK